MEREVLLFAATVNEWTVVAFGLIIGALAGMMADAGTGPHVVHGPYHGFARGENLFDVLQREHALVDPVQVNDVRLLEFGQRSNVRACIGYIYGEDILPFEVVGNQNDDAFPHEFPYHPPVLVQRHDGDLVGLFISYQQLGFDAMILKGFHQSAGCYGCSTDTFGCVY